MKVGKTPTLNEKYYKGSKGFSYVEILMALGLFALMLGVALPLMYQAGRNMSYAETSYINHLLAQEKLNIVRAAILDQQDINAVARNFADLNYIYDFGVWVFGEISHEYATDSNLQVEYVGHGLGGSTIIIVISDEVGNLSGRAIGRVWT